MDWENKIINGIHATRYIVSWVKFAGYNFGRINGPFWKWLESVGVTDEDDLYLIYRLATNGKMELESSAMRFIKENNI